jgi:hypothetical protein
MDDMGVTRVPKAGTNVQAVRMDKGPCRRSKKVHGHAQTRIHRVGTKVCGVGKPT